MRNGKTHNVVMIADDDAMIRTLVKKGLDGLAEFVEVADGADVLKAYFEHRPDVLFLDIHLPNVKGYNLIPNIRGMDPEAYIIMLSADSTEHNVKRTVQKGASAFLTKPFNAATLLDRFSRCPTLKFIEHKGTDPDKASGQGQE